MKRILWAACAIALSCSALAREAAEPVIDGVRFNAFAAGPDKAGLVARGAVGQDPLAVRAAFEQFAKALCSDGRVIEPLTPGQYGDLPAPYAALAPDASGLMSLARFHELKQAPALSGTVECNHAAAGRLADPALKVFIVNELGEAVPYFDQGFASFNNARLDVPIVGTTIADTLSRSVLDALQARGYRPSMAESPDRADIVVNVGKGNVPQERFDGLALMTKLSMISVTSRSIEFCSVVVTVRRQDRSDKRYAVGANMRKQIKPIYTNWKNEMAAGPAADVHRQSSADLTALLSDAVGGAIHRLPPVAFEGPSERR